MATFIKKYPSMAMRPICGGGGGEETGKYIVHSIEPHDILLVILITFHPIRCVEEEEEANYGVFTPNYGVFTVNGQEYYLPPWHPPTSLVTRPV